MMSEDKGNRLDDMNYITTIDKNGLFSLIDGFPEQLERGVQSFPEKISFRSGDYSSIGLVGLGTSRVCSEVLSAVMNGRGNLPVFSLHDYFLPHWVGRSTLLIFLSFTGNTEEVISCFQQSLKRKCNSIVVTGGGYLGEKAVAQGVPLITIQKESPPNRTVFPSMIVPVLLYCRRCGFFAMHDGEIKQAADFLRHQRVSLTIRSPAASNYAKKIALYFYKRLPLIYADDAQFRAVVLRWQYQLNENAKSLAYSSYLPEMSHNELIGLQGSDNLSQVSTLFITSRDKRESILEKRASFTRSVLAQKGYSVMDVTLKGNGILQKLFYGIVLADYASFYLAVLRGKNPQEVDLIDKIKMSRVKQD
jgi:glucose/mannose-6-phosphate isomerase